MAVNGTVYDVSAAPSTYGPGGPYHIFAGRDATRAFVTGCFQQDLTPDIRGVEEMFMPVYKVVDEDAYLEQQQRREREGKSTDRRDGGDDRSGGKKKNKERHDHAGPAGPGNRQRGKDHRRADGGGDGKEGKSVKYDDEVDQDADRREAHKAVHETIAHWMALFAGQKGAKPYFEVGKVVVPADGKGTTKLGPVPTLCEPAVKMRPTQTVVRRAKKNPE